MEPAATPSDEYRRHERSREIEAANLDRVHLRFGNLRLLLVIGALIAAWFSFHLRAFTPWWLLLFFAAFCALVIAHARVLRRHACAERAAEFYRKGLARIEDRWTGLGNTGAPVDTHSSLYAADLDLFGHGSLFELLSLARTRMGEDTLAGWLLQPSPVSQLIERHAAIAELRSRLDLREQIAIAGDAPKIGVHPDALMQWAEAPNQLTQKWLRWLSLALAIAAAATAFVWADLGVKAPFFAIVLTELVIVAVCRRQTAEVLHSTGHALEDLKLLSSLLARIEREHFQSPRLQAIHASLFSHRIAGSDAIGRLGTIVDYIRSLENPGLRLLNIPLLYSVQTAYAAEAWRSAHGPAVRTWLNSLGEMEALLSLSAYSYEHPADPFPEFLEGTPCFVATGLGHPLLPAAQCVRNDFSICGETRIVLISGSNMSGKSTLMRAIGVNTVLAMAGAPIRATSLRLTPLHLGASILINDSLQEGSSRFYAEITRLRHICDLAETKPPALFLLDELLQGTNSKDRLIGAEGVVQALFASGAIGVISTHDLALTNIGGHRDSRLRNLHLEDRIEDGRMKFDFKLQDGVVARSNGVELMRLIGLKV